MEEFKGNLLILGCGSVAQCVLPLIVKHIKMPLNRITIMDYSDQRERVSEFLSLGIRYVFNKITEENYAESFSRFLGPGDFLLDLAWNLETVQLLDWCHRHDVFFLNTSVELWNPNSYSHRNTPEKLTLYHRQMQLKELTSQWKSSSGPTAIVDHGANPGLVSHFVKQGLIDIASKIIAENPSDSRVSRLSKAIHNQSFAEIAYSVGLKTVHISERDTQITRDPKRVGEFVNTWSVEGFIEEGVAPAELGWGTHERELPKSAGSYSYGPKNQIYLAQKGVKTWVRSWVPSGPITGMVIRHGEAFSISDALTFREGETLVYRPTVHYAYCPCDAAINSLHEFEMSGFIPQTQRRILSNDIISGKDELGCLLMGHDFGAWWIGSVLDIEEARRLVPGQNATTVQVAIGVVSAMIYILKHPKMGLCLPDHLDHREILPIVKPYLGKFLSIPVEWSPLDNATAFCDFKEQQPPPEDKWQFSTFLVSPKPQPQTSSLAHSVKNLLEV